MSSINNINILIKIESFLEKWNNEQINADECLYQINKLIEEDDDRLIPKSKEK